MAMHYGILPAMVAGTDPQTGLPLYDDRAVDEAYFARFHAEMLDDGISAKNAESFQVTATDTLSVAVKPGAAFIRGYFAYDDSETILELKEPDAALSRLDRVVLRLDKPAREITLEARSGEPGQSQLTPPALERDDDVWELCLAEITVPAGAPAITQANIADTRPDNDLCGITANPLGGVNDELFRQYDQVFQDWYSRLKDILNENAAGNLQTQIDEHTGNSAIHFTMDEIDDLVAEGKSSSERSGSVQFKNGLLLQWGSFNASTTANTTKEYHVAFEKEYAHIPYVTSNPYSGATSTCMTSVSYEATDGFNLYFYRTSTTSANVGWFAVGIAADA